jgi:hypothetical protein
VSDLGATVEREAVAGTTSVGDLGELIDAPRWLADEDVLRIDAVGGKIPISWTPDGTVARIALPGGSEFVYLAVEEELTAPELAGGLRGDAGAERASAAIIRQIAVHRSG